MEQEITEAYAIKDKLEAETKAAVKDDKLKLTQKSIKDLNIQEEADNELKKLME